MRCVNIRKDILNHALRDSELLLSRFCDLSRVVALTRVEGVEEMHSDVGVSTFRCMPVGRLVLLVPVHRALSVQDEFVLKSSARDITV